jgi:predicted DsbA family dithiol-disulfide isomerase/uncharacterized membrane protein
MRSKLSSAALLVVPVLVGLTASAALLVDYLHPSPVFCSEAGGCEAVKHSALAWPFGVPMPAFGLLGFAVMGALVFARGPLARTLYCLVAIGAAIVGIGLILVQLAMLQFCVYCTAVDISACVACGLSIWRFRRGFDLEVPGAARGGIVALLVAMPALVLALGLTAKVKLPDVIAEEMKKAPKGRATIVEFVDFECPFCRSEYDNLVPLLEAAKDRVYVIRKLVPLTRIHPHALVAARAACCADLQGKGDDMADALFHAPIEELTPEGCQKIASALGLDLTRYAACLTDPKTAERIIIDRAVFDSAAEKRDGLPLLWIGERKISGLRDPSELQRALDEAIAKAGS